MKKLTNNTKFIIVIVLLAMLIPIRLIQKLVATSIMNENNRLEAEYNRLREENDSLRLKISEKRGSDAMQKVVEDKKLSRVEDEFIVEID